MSRIGGRYKQIQANDCEIVPTIQTTGFYEHVLVRTVELLSTLDEADPFGWALPKLFW
jgi:hypothetical protein